LWAQQGNVIYPIAQQNMDAYQRDQWNRGSGTRTDMKPSDFMPKEDNSKTDVEGAVCSGAGAAGTGLSACYSEKGTISVSASVFGAKATIYANPETKYMGGCVGVGGPLGEAGPLGVSASAQVCGDKDKGLTFRTTTGVGLGQVSTTTYDRNR
jgi:hypothetical protein